MTRLPADPVIRRLLLIGSLCWLAAAIVIALAWTGVIVGADRWAIERLRPSAEAMPLATEAMRWATWLGDWPRRLAIAGAFFAYLVWRRFGRAASYILYTTLGIWALNAWALKPMFGRARPDGAGELVAVGASHALPSGHAANAAAVFTAIALVASVIWWRRMQRRAIWSAAAIAILLVGVSRVWLAAHWPSDVAAGWLVGLGWALLLAALLKPVKARESSRR
ncbi:PAP2 family protein [Sphingomonas gilva]|uniref:PAP2 family protein n=1 Tax=Sphingomonas gilva TaxID=2305907 RepID=A0A396RSB4_9SPHN|nr:phosphatase PAP2 family protein [Sphingomonas gilva]RHW19478.1 PAP2 family protein [Sphingomonas gilva]